MNFRQELEEETQVVILRAVQCLVFALALMMLALVSL